MRALALFALLLAAPLTGCLGRQVSSPVKPTMRVTRSPANAPAEPPPKPIEADPEHPITGKKLGAPVYPGAKTVTGDLEEAASTAAGVVVFTTPDSVAKVKAFYEKQLKTTARVTAGGKKTMLVSAPDSGPAVTVQISRPKKNGPTLIVINVAGEDE